MFELPKQVNTENKLGYHRGNLKRKSDQLCQMGSRSTGYFGTGFYFCVGDYADIDAYKGREHWVFDLSEYKLIRGTVSLHETLKKLNNYIVNYGVISTLKERKEIQAFLKDCFKWDYDHWDEYETVFFICHHETYQEQQELLKGLLKDKASKELYTEFSYLIKEGKRWDNCGYYEIDYGLKEKIHSFFSDDWFNPEFTRSMDHMDFWEQSRDLGIDVAGVEEVCAEVWKTLSRYDQNGYLKLQNTDEEDSIPTRILKILGYEGVYPMPECNDTYYGGVIFDLKEGTYQKDPSFEDEEEHLQESSSLLVRNLRKLREGKDYKYKAKIGDLYLQGKEFTEDPEEADVFESETEPRQRINQMKRDKKGIFRSATKRDLEIKFEKVKE